MSSASGPAGRSPRGAPAHGWCDDVVATRFADLQTGESLGAPARTTMRAGDPAAGDDVAREAQASENPGAGAERAVRLGGVGTPWVREFACAELGARMQMGTVAARHYLADALDVRHRLPLMWERVLEHRVRIGWVREVATRTRHLSPEAAAFVDAAMADCVDGSLPWGRFCLRLEGKVLAADPVVGAEGEAKAAGLQFARRSRSSRDGMAGFYARSSIGVIARIEATVAYVAEGLRALGDTDDEDLRRVKALLVLCNPCQGVELAYAAARSGGGVGENAEPPVEVDAGIAPDGAGIALDGAGIAPDGAEDGVEVPRPDVYADHTGVHGSDRPSAPSARAADALDRMRAFARRVRFTPRRLPAWLTAGGEPGHGEAHHQVQPEFRFDWSELSRR